MLGGLHQGDDSGIPETANLRTALKEDRRTVAVKRNGFNDAIGLRLSRRALRVLRERGIFAQSSVSLQHQQVANRYVVRGLESGGAAGDIGRYVTFAQEDGRPIEYLYPVESIGVNGIHAVVIAPVLVRVDMVRRGRTYELLITEHVPGKTENGRRPQLETTILFRGFHGRIELDLWGKDKSQAGLVVPTFYSLAGEVMAIPAVFIKVVQTSVLGCNCAGCSHSHYLLKPKPAAAAPLPAIASPAPADTGLESTVKDRQEGNGERGSKDSPGVADLGVICANCGHVEMQTRY
jgi:hypothetical protein